MKSTSKTIVAIRRERSEPGDIYLAIVDGKYNSSASATQGKAIEQILNRSNQSDVAFEERDVIIIRPESVTGVIEVNCREDHGKIMISKEEYQRVTFNLIHQSEESEESADDYHQFNASDDQAQQPAQPRKRGRPKGSKNRKKNNNKSYSESDDEEMYEEKKRGRGRPKGSRNKKNLKKQLNQQLTLRVLMGGRIVKSAQRNNFPRVESSENTFRDDRSEKRGKGRPKGSKNKAKYQQKMIEKGEQLIRNAQSTEEQPEKRHRGRPKGVKNKPREQPESQQMSAFDQEYGISLPGSAIAVENCCEKCTDRQFKERIMGVKSAHEALRMLKELKDIANIWEDVRLERRDNLFLWALKANSLPLVRQCLTQIRRTKRFFRPVWETDGKLQHSRFTTRTRKEALSKSGKEGLTVLLHDVTNTTFDSQWWNTIGIDRILESMSNQTKKEILDCLVSHSTELQTCLIENIPILVRSGNFSVARYLMKDIAPAQYNKYGFSKEHLECLDQSNSKIQFKKNNLLKQNFCSNFCSPIHCAAVNPNSELLEYLLTNIPDYNVGDSLNMKPVHYAAAAITKRNLEVLLKHGSDLKDMDKHRMTPLMVAAYHGRQENVQFILNNANESTYINFISEEGYSALHYAILRGHLNCVTLFISNPNVKLDIQTKDKQTPLHLACSFGNYDIYEAIIDTGVYFDCYDRHNRTPIMSAVRNHNNRIVEDLLERKCKHYKEDNSLNSVLHYAAAYGNFRILNPLLQRLMQRKNKRNYYPWELAVGKGHMGCARMLEDPNTVSEEEFQLMNNMAMMAFRVMDGTNEALDMMRYLIDSGKYNLNELDPNGSNVLHYICSIGRESYERNRGSEDSFVPYDELQGSLIDLLLRERVQPNLSNKKGQTPIDLCVQNGNIVGMKMLLTSKVSLSYESSSGMTILHYLSRVASKSCEGIEFVIDRLSQLDKTSLKENLKRVDVNGFEFILYFVRDFTCEVITNFQSSVQRGVSLVLQATGLPPTQQQNIEIHKSAFSQFSKHEELFIKLVCFLMEQGCDANVQVVDKRKDDDQESLKKWGIQHFLMKFPSLKLLSLFRRKIRDFNSQNNSGMTALHLFCSLIRKGNLFGSQVEFPEMADYCGEKSLQFLLQNGLNPNILDMNRSTPLLYAALNQQISFMILLRRFGSIINNCNNRNQVPFIEIIKAKQHFTIQEIESVLKIGADPNYEDLEKRTSLHHIVYTSSNLDHSPELCKILFDYHVKVNSLDKYNRTPLFYCFTRIDIDQKDSASPPSDKMEILQALINHRDININHVDVYHRTALHYACEKNYFFSVVYLLEAGLNIDTEIKDFEGNTPLAICLIHRNLNQAAILLKRGVKEGDVVDSEKRYSYFAYAIHKMFAGICYMLLDNGYPVDKALRQTNSESLRNQLVKRYCTPV